MKKNIIEIDTGDDDVFCGDRCPYLKFFLNFECSHFRQRNGLPASLRTKNNRAKRCKRCVETVVKNGK